MSDVRAVHARPETETPEELEFELRAAEGSLWTGGRLLIGILIFAFAGLAFAYFYLRSANSEGLWRPHGITAPTEVGAAIFAVALATGAVNYFGTRRFHLGSVVDWEVAAWTAVGGGLLAVGLQIWELTRLPFYPGSSGYSSCFVAWAGMNIAFLLGAVYWLETLAARALRLRREVGEDGGAARSTAPTARLFRGNLEACTYFWGFVGLVELLFWLLFYVV